MAYADQPQSKARTAAIILVVLLSRALVTPWLPGWPLTLSKRRSRTSRPSM